MDRFWGTVVVFLVGIVSVVLGIYLRGVKARAEKVQDDLAAFKIQVEAYKLHVAERYINTDAWVLALSEIKKEIKGLRDLLMKQWNKEK